MPNLLRWIGSGLDRGLPNASGGLLGRDSLTPEQRAAGRSATLYDIGSIIASRGLQDANSAGALALNILRQRQAEQEQGRATANQALYNAALTNSGPEAARALALRLGNIDLAKATGELVPKQAEPKVIGRNDYAQRTLLDGSKETGFVTSDGQFHAVPNLVAQGEEDAWRATGSGGMLFNPKTGEFKEPPSEPEIREIRLKDGTRIPGYWSQDGWVGLDKEPIPMGQIAGVSDNKNSNAQARILQGFVDAANGDEKKGIDEYLKATNKSSEGDAVKSMMAAAIGNSIIRGDQPPDLQRLYGLAGPVRQYLADQGFDLAGAQLNWEAERRMGQSANSTQAFRIKAAASYLAQTSPYASQQTENLAQVLGSSDIVRSRYPVINGVALAAIRNGIPGIPADEMARLQTAERKYTAAVNELIPELATLQAGGYATTDDAREIAKNIVGGGDASPAQLLASLQVINETTQLRLKSLEGIQPSFPRQGQAAPGVQRVRRYNPQTGQFEDVEQ